MVPPSLIDITLGRKLNMSFSGGKLISHHRMGHKEKVDVDDQ
jgi:hypothetical protein